MPMDVLELTKELVSVESTAEKPENLKRVLEIADEALPGELKRWRYERNGKPSLVVGFEDTKEPEILVLAHLDVVPGKPEQFNPRVEGDRLLGRGALDMKGPAAAVIVALGELWEEGKRPSAALMLTTDEEVGSPDGVAYLVREEGWRARFAFVPDGGPNFTLVVKGKGAYHFKAYAKGLSAHGSMPWLGSSAVEKILGFYEDLGVWFYTSEPCGDPDHWHETLNLGVIKGGVKVNVIPEGAEAHFDIRFTERWSVEAVRRTVRALADRWGVQIEEEATGEPFSTPPDNPYVQRLLRAGEELGIKLKLGHEHGATDGRFFAERGVPVALLYPVGGNIHADGEWVSVESLRKFKDLVKNFLAG